MLLTGVLYPLCITLIGYLLPFHVDGSFLLKDNKPIGSLLIGQQFTSERYFWGRPSAHDYNPLESGGSNLGPTSAALAELVNRRKQQVAHAHNVELNRVPSELIYASGSGLDPHISVSCAEFQIERVMRARGMQGSEQRSIVRSLIDQFTEGRILVRLGQPCVNVLQLNAALDATRQRPTGVQ